MRQIGDALRQKIKVLGSLVKCFKQQLNIGGRRAVSKYSPFFTYHSAVLTSLNVKCCSVSLPKEILIKKRREKK